MLTSGRRINPIEKIASPIPPRKTNHRWEENPEGQGEALLKDPKETKRDKGQPFHTRIKQGVDERKGQTKQRPPLNIKNDKDEITDKEIATAKITEMAVKYNKKGYKSKEELEK